MSDDKLDVVVRVSRQLARDIAADEHLAEDMQLALGREVVDEIIAKANE